MVYTFIWGIGALFSCGVYSGRVTYQRLSELEHLVTYCGLVLFWPHYLGYYIGMQSK